MSNPTVKELENVLHIQNMFYLFVSDFLKNCKVDMVKEWNSDDNQLQLKGMLKFCFTSKPKRDSNTPIRPRSALILYGKAIRQQIKTDHPNKKGPEITKIISAKWSSVNDKTKRKYLMLAKQDRERFNEEMVNYIPRS